MSDDDEITMREAGAYAKHPLTKGLIAEPDDPDELAALHRARELAEPSAQLDAMLAASRRGKTVRK